VEEAVEGSTELPAFVFRGEPKPTVLPDAPPVEVSKS
jgi:ATP-dependent Clp protease ATP-binding subunit ClpC